MSLSVNNIGDAGARYVSEALSSGNCQLTQLNLGGNNIGDAGTQHVGEALSSGNCHLELLYMDHNKIGEAGENLRNSNCIIEL